MNIIKFITLNRLEGWILGSVGLFSFGWGISALVNGHFGGLFFIFCSWIMFVILVSRRRESGL